MGLTLRSSSILEKQSGRWIVQGFEKWSPGRKRPLLVIRRFNPDFFTSIPLRSSTYTFFSRSSR